MKKLLEDQQIRQKLAERLSKVKTINKHNHGDHKEEWIIAYGLSDMEDSFHEISILVSELLKDGISDQEVLDALTEIGVNLNHIVYHCKTSKHFDLYIQDVEKEEKLE